MCEYNCEYNCESNYEEELEACKKHIGRDAVLWMGKPALNEEDEQASILGGILVFFSIIAAFVFKTREVYIMAGFLCFFAFLFCGGREFFEDIRRKNTFYVITKRKIIRKRGSKIDFTYTSFRHDMEVSIKNNGYGSITFLNLPIAKLTSYEFGKESNMKNFFYLDNIPNVREVEKLLRDLSEKKNVE